MFDWRFWRFCQSSVSRLSDDGQLPAARRPQPPPLPPPPLPFQLPSPPPPPLPRPAPPQPLPQLLLPQLFTVGIPNPNPNPLMFRTMLDDLGLELGALGRQHYSTVIKF